MAGRRWPLSLIVVGMVGVRARYRRVDCACRVLLVVVGLVGLAWAGVLAMPLPLMIWEARSAT